MQKPTLYIICGLPYSGKTTLSKRIANSEWTRSERISFDDLYQEKKSSLGKGSSKVTEWEYITRIAQGRIKHALKNHMSVVYDNTNDRYNQRVTLRSIAEKSGASVKVVYVDTPLEVVKKRREDNKVSKERHDVSQDNFDNAIKGFQPPTPDEHAIVYKIDKDIESWLRFLGSVIREESIS